jgi:4-hydroxy-3-polyprenylbenzoate decarboxylase
MLGIRFLDAVGDLGIETHLVISRGARRTIALEGGGITINEVQEKASVAYSPDDIAAPVASGSFPSLGMVVIPCSMNTLSAIASAASPDLLARAADVTLKEGRPLVLVPRESPMHLGHLRNMVAAAEYGAKICPPVLGGYFAPDSIDDIVDHLIGRILDQLGIDNDLARRWAGAPGPDSAERA